MTYECIRELRPVKEVVLRMSPEEVSALLGVLRCTKLCDQCVRILERGNFRDALSLAYAECGGID